MMYFSTLCIFIAIFFILKSKRKFRFALLTLFLLLISFLLTITYAVSDYFTDKGIDESVIYHLRYGLGEAGFQEYAGVIILAAVALITTVGLFYYLIKDIARKQKYISDDKVINNFPIILSVLAIALSPASENLYSLIKSEFSGSVVNGEDYVKVNENFVKEPLNLIYVYAESLEETYFNESLFPGLLPNLNKVRNNAVVFKNVAQVTHSGWTIAGMVASQCGVPLFSASQGNAMSGMPQFLSGATCMGDVLRRNKYDLSYLGGASLEFAGKGHFYKTHGFSSVQGRAELSTRLEEASYQSAWGLYDDSLFAIAKEELAEHTERNNPFALFMLTLDTHHPKGHLSGSCEDHRYGDGENAILNIVHCSDKLISDFVNYLQTSGLDKNTLIVIGYDHLAMKNTATDLLNQGDRKNMLIMIPPDLQEGIVIDTPSSILDVAATILPLLGFKSEELGFGRNILNTKKPKLIEKYKDFNSYLNSSSALVASFWNYPEAVNDIKINGEKNKAYFGKEVVKYPALFLIDDNYLTDKVLFEFNSEKKLSEYLQGQEKGRKILWIDQCNKIGSIFESNQKLDELKNCIAIGSIGSESLFIKNINDVTEINKNKILDELKKQSEKITQESYQKQINILNRFTRNGANIEDYQVLSNDSLYESILIKSVAGVDDGESFITYSDGSSQHTLKGFMRGVNLVGFSNGKQPRIIHRLDTCQISKNFESDKNIREILNDHNEDFYLLISHDSTVCENRQRLEQYMMGSHLKLWPDLAWRQAYVSIIYKDGQSLELLGENGQSINIVLK
ncbi:sulfatase-like hydrolase/transferase [Denitrificimonas caeni]|uniref:sulfatase-like hydrolase/transferase n=1 Tax=Denitrificimonas caeni TaxID=521720 RepID=UPI001962BFA3|nr:sulfatase-like hydrolase/transferase [Denitrificimonas caeni]